MVREVRFSREDADGMEPPDRRDRFDELDDFLDDFLPPAPSAPPVARRARPARRKRLPHDRPVRHLAGADWLREPPVAPPPADASDAPPA